MRKTILSAVALVLPFGAAQAAPANTSSASGSATATVVAPIVLTHTTSAALNFGKFTSGTTSGTIAVSAAGAATASGDVTLLPGSASSADSFAVAGEAGRAFSIATTNGSVTNGAASMTFTTSPSSVSGTLGSGGTATFTVGGTLSVPASATAGSYSGSYSATVTYN
ncbi:DUF4402 domain-containing protein [Novosphingobium olei]|uniref:DUF4402 domain-containing protein n=1 Tax=Novosphingobium olei TaxID=2728851 RepID=A0A7Y0GBD3_9SPHN|nr:DUF4402 domain-containing protein [Novosphingobium olei]NML96171.1 DUF4402 domain-containing protein [Novosphingobium olei]